MGLMGSEPGGKHADSEATCGLHYSIRSLNNFMEGAAVRGQDRELAGGEITMHACMGLHGAFAEIGRRA